MKTSKSYGELNDLNLNTLIALTRGFQSIRERELKTIRQGGLTLAQFAVLEILYHKGRLRVSDIIDGTLSTAGNMTVVIRNLEKEELINRVRDASDRRASLIRITEKGQQIMEEIFPDHVENVSEIFNVLTAEEKHSVIALMKKLQIGKKTEGVKFCE